MSFGDRNSALLRILEINSAIYQIERGKKFQRVRGDLRVLERGQKGERIIPVHSPEDPELLVSLARSSPDIPEFIERYRAILKPDMDRLETLLRERESLESKLFLEKPKS